KLLAHSGETIVASGVQRLWEAAPECSLGMLMVEAWLRPTARIFGKIVTDSHDQGPMVRGDEWFSLLSRAAVDVVQPLPARCARHRRPRGRSSPGVRAVPWPAQQRIRQ